MWLPYAGRRIYLDANIVIYALEKGMDWLNACQSLLDAIDRRIIVAVTSEITIGEVIAKPIASNNDEVLSRYYRFFDLDSYLELYPVTRSLLFLSGLLQAAIGLRVIDALHLATAQEAQCDYMLTHDERLGRSMPNRLKWLCLSDVGA